MPINFICPICDKELPRELRTVVPHTNRHIIEAIKGKHPEWVDKEGICEKCYDHYKKQLHPD